MCRMSGHDTDSALRFLEALCEHWGHEVLVAGDGAEGLALARRTTRTW